MSQREPIHITVPGNPDDPRVPHGLPEDVIVHYAPELHPDDVCVVRGVRTTSPSRTLIDLAEVLEPAELRECFENARSLGILDLDELGAARARVEWRPSLAMLDEVIEEFS